MSSPGPFSTTHWSTAISPCRFLQTVPWRGPADGTVFPGVFLKPWQCNCLGVRCKHRGECVYRHFDALFGGQARDHADDRSLYVPAPRQARYFFSRGGRNLVLDVSFNDEIYRER